MPERFLLQILRNLVTHGILRSTRGVDGGYSLVRPADEVSVLDVIEAIEGPMDVELNLGEGFFAVVAGPSPHGSQSCHDQRATTPQVDQDRASA